MKHVINVPLLIEQLKRLWAIPVALGLTLFLVFIMPIYITASQQHHWNTHQRIIMQLLTMNHVFLLFLSVIVPVVAAFALFSHQFNMTANTALVGLPVSRRQIFCTNVLAGFLMYGVPLLVLSLVLLIPVQAEGLGAGWIPDQHGQVFHYSTEIIEGVTHSFGWSRSFLMYWSSHIWGYLTTEMIAEGFTINTPWVVLGFLGRTLLMFSFYFGLGLMAVSVTGSRLVALIIAAIVAFLPQIVLGLVWVIGNAYVFGFANSNNDFFFAQTLFFMHPVLMGQYLSSTMWIWMPDIHIGFVYLVQLSIMAGFAGVAYFCNQRRRAERTGDTVAFTPLKIVLIMVLSLTGMLFGGVIFLGLTESRIGYYVGFIVGFVVIYFIAQMVMEKTLLIWHKVRRLGIFAGVGVGLYLMMVFITHVGMLPYITRVPDYNEIRGVYIWHRWPGPMTNPQGEGVLFQFVTDREIISRTRSAHEEIISNRGSLRSHIWEQMSGRPTMSEMVPISYQLTDGTLVHRMYRLPRAFVMDSDLEALAREEEVILSQQVALMNPQLIHSISLSIGWSSHGWDTHRDEWWMREAAAQLSDWQGTGFIITDREDIFSLIDSLRQDYIEHSINQQRRSRGELPWRNESHMIINVDFAMIGAGTFSAPTRWRHLHITEVEHTLAWLEGYVGENLDHLR